MLYNIKIKINLLIFGWKALFKDNLLFIFNLIIHVFKEIK